MEYRIIKGLVFGQPDASQWKMYMALIRNSRKVGIIYAFRYY